MDTSEAWQAKLKDIDITKTNFKDKAMFGHLLFRYAYKRSPELKKLFYTKKLGKKYREGIDVAHENETDVLMNLIFDNPSMDVETFKKETLRNFTSMGWPVPNTEYELVLDENLEPFHPGLSYEPEHPKLIKELQDAMEQPRSSDFFQPLVLHRIEPKRRTFLFVLSFIIFIVLAIIFVIYDTATR